MSTILNIKKFDAELISINDASKDNIVRYLRCKQALGDWWFRVESWGGFSSIDEKEVIKLETLYANAKNKIYPK